MYKIYKNEENEIVGIVRDSDNASIPIDNGNVNYQEYTEWVDAGNTAETYIPPTPPADE